MTSRLDTTTSSRRPKTLLAAIGLVVAMCVPFSVTALAQGTIVPEATGTETPAADPAAASDPSATAQPTVTATATTPPPAATAPVVAPPVPAVPPQGQWVYTDTYGWIWVPAGTTSVLVQEQPYVYIYTPTYGWTWYGSPWGPGAYYVGPWVHRGWGPARVWHRGGWYAPHVVVRSRGPAPGFHGGGGHGAPAHHGGRR